MNNLLELLEANQELTQLIEREIDNLTVKEFVQLHEQGILHEGKLSSIIGLGSKAKNAVKQFGINVLGDKENQKTLKAAINQIQDDIEVPFPNSSTQKYQKLRHRIDKMEWESRKRRPGFLRNLVQDMHPDAKLIPKLKAKSNHMVQQSHERYLKSSKAEAARLRALRDLEVAKLKKSQKSVDDARITAGIIAGSSVAAPIGLKIESDLYNARKESKKSRVEKLKDKIKDIITKD